MSVYAFPTLEDRTMIHNLIGYQSQGKCSRDDMMRWVAHIIEKYNVDKMPIFGYSVRILQYYKDLPIISIESDTISEKCPGCGAGTKDARYLRTQKENFDQSYDLVNVTCLECGCVYTVKGDNHRQVNREVEGK